MYPFFHGPTAPPIASQSGYAMVPPVPSAVIPTTYPPHGYIPPPYYIMGDPAMMGGAQHPQYGPVPSTSNHISRNARYVPYAADLGRPKKKVVDRRYPGTTSSASETDEAPPRKVHKFADQSLDGDPTRPQCKWCKRLNNYSVSIHLRRGSCPVREAHIREQKAALEIPSQPLVNNAVPNAAIRLPNGDLYYPSTPEEATTMRILLSHVPLAQLQQLARVVAAEQRDPVAAGGPPRGILQPPVSELAAEAPQGVDRPSIHPPFARTANTDTSGGILAEVSQTGQVLVSGLPSATHVGSGNGFNYSHPAASVTVTEDHNICATSRSNNSDTETSGSKVDDHSTSSNSPSGDFVSSEENDNIEDFCASVTYCWDD